jgi:hypothetical protein
MDVEGDYKIFDLKERIQKQALLKCYIEFLVIPSRIILVYKGELDNFECSPRTFLIVSYGRSHSKRLFEDVRFVFDQCEIECHRCSGRL